MRHIYMLTVTNIVQFLQLEPRTTEVVRRTFENTCSTRMLFLCVFLYSSIPFSSTLAYFSAYFYERPTTREEG